MPCGETRWQRGLHLIYWPPRFWNSLYIAGRNNNNLGISSYNISCETKHLGAVCGVRSLPGAGHVLGLWRTIEGPTWWFFAGHCPCISLAGLERRRERRREREWEQEPKPEREWEHKRWRICYFPRWELLRAHLCRQVEDCDGYMGLLFDWRDRLTF